MKRARAPKSRALLSAIASKLEAKGTTTIEIVATALREHPAVIDAEIRDLVEGFLLKMASDVLAKKARSAAPAQMELFREYALPRTICIGKRDGVDVFKAIDAATIGEIRKSLVTRPPRTRPRRDAEKVRLLEELEPFAASDESTVAECWELKRGHG